MSDSTVPRWPIVVGILGIIARGLDYGRLSSGTEANIHRLAELAVVVAVVCWLFFWYRARRASIYPFAEALDVPTQLYRESYGMVSYALERGFSLDPRDIAAVEDARVHFDPQPTALGDGPPLGQPAAPSRQLIQRLVATHTRLADLVKPAMPKTLELLNYRRGQYVFTWLGPVRLVRMMVFWAILLIPAFVFLALSIGTKLDADNWLTAAGTSSTDRYVTAAYLITASAVGATFAALFKAYRYIGNLSYDDQYESSYWVRWIQGVLAGLIMAILISRILNLDPPTGDQAGATAFRITVPLLALVGGFSSDLLYRILKRIVDAVETLIQGSASERIEAEQQQAEIRLKTQSLEGQQSTTAILLDIRSTLPADATRAHNTIDRMLAQSLGAGATEALTIVEPADPETIRLAPGEDVTIRLKASPALDPGAIIGNVHPPELGELVRDGSSLSWRYTAGSDAGPAMVTVTFISVDEPRDVDQAAIEIVSASPAGPAGA